LADPIPAAHDDTLRAVKILLEGRPGSGKTTVVRRLVEVLRASGAEVAGFTTEEVRERGRRRGFAVESVEGERAILADVDLPGPVRVGKYGVDLEAFERIAIPSLEPAGADVVVIDELGKMELASRRFQQAVARVFDRAEPVVATIHVFRHEFTDGLRARPGVRTCRVAGRNRNALPEHLAGLLAPRGR
jgi:nucleoside-triphosphatase